MPGPGEQNITYSSLANIELISSISRSISDWNVQDTDERTYNVDDPKIEGLTFKTSSSTDPETGETRFGSNDYYSGPNVALNTANQYIDPRTGETKKLNGKVLTPHFRLGAATEVFSGLSQEAIFEIQQELSSLGLDIGSYNFVPESVAAVLFGIPPDCTVTPLNVPPFNTTSIALSYSFRNFCNGGNAGDSLSNGSFSQSLSSCII